MAEPPPEPGDELCNHQDRYQQRASVGLEPFESLGVVVVVCVVGIQRPPHTSRPETGFLSLKLVQLYGCHWDRSIAP